MNTKHERTLIGSCRCGAVAFEADGPPIMSVACYCESCQAAGDRIERRADAPPVLGRDGGTDFVLHRKDRIRFIRGGERLEELRLKPDSTSRRMVANCCNSAMYLEFKNGHWLSLYSDRLTGVIPPVEMRTMTRDRREDVELPADVPNHATQSGEFMWKLLTAWVAMGFRVPRVSGVPA